jgi:tetratricopeptide (TPR) repeat protein
MAFVGSLPPKEASEKERAAVRRAQQIDESLPEVHIAHAILAWSSDWDWPTVETECQRVFELSPNDSDAHNFCGQCSRALGRFDEAIIRMKKAEELDPLSADIGRGLGITYYWAGRYDEAIAQLRKVLELAPQDAQTHEALADVYARKGMQKESIAELQQAFLLAGDKDASEALGQDFASLGFDGVMKHLNQVTLEGHKESAKEGYVSPVAFATSYAKLGERDHAFSWLDKAYDERSPWLTYIKTDPAFDSLHSDPRFADLLRRVGLPP